MNYIFLSKLAWTVGDPRRSGGFSKISTMACGTLSSLISLSGHASPYRPYTKICSCPHLPRLPSFHQFPHLFRIFGSWLLLLHGTATEPFPKHATGHDLYCTWPI
ncbi:unnamed protein product [Linum trigynum]|uniref:Uncharacterized protein n=1 Tax=Linum trigynum TaxID=586398 RepID=A0AAV2EE29_9ROSI